MVTQQRKDLNMNIPALRDLDAMLIVRIYYFDMVSSICVCIPSFDINILFWELK